MIKKCGFKVLEDECEGLIDPIYIFPNNEQELKGRHRELLSDENIKQASGRAFSHKENLVVMEGRITLVWVMKCKKYTLKQFYATMVDGASTPVTIGDIDPVAPHTIRAFKVHDDLYGMFPNVPRKIADQIYVCFLEADGCRRAARVIQYASLRMFGKKARNLEPKKHWNYGRVTLRVEDYVEL
jgi:hypothetical protein